MGGSSTTTLVATAVWWGLAYFPIMTALDAQNNGHSISYFIYPL